MLYADSYVVISRAEWLKKAALPSAYRITAASDPCSNNTAQEQK